MQSIKVTKLETSSDQKSIVLEHQVGTGSNISKISFTKTAMAEVAIYKNKKNVLCACNNSCILQLGMFRVTVIHKGKQNHVDSS